jgi:molybdate transport system regulatory protein
MNARRQSVGAGFGRPSRKPASLVLRVVLGPRASIGPGKVRLLEAIDRTESISAAARRLGMSYRRAWLLVDAMNRTMRTPVVETARGGRGGGGARLTPLGREVIAAYRGLERRARGTLHRELSGMRRLID